MRTMVFSSRNTKEILRDPVSLIFGVGLPVVVLVIISTIAKSIPEGAQTVFKIEYFAPSIAVFSFAFISLFVSMLISSDRSTSFLTRLYASPLTAADFIIGYSIPMLPIAIIQSVICFAIAVVYGLKINYHLAFEFLALIPIAILFIAFGILIGSLCTYKQAGPISSILIQVTALGSGMWFSLDLVGGAFKTVCNLLPFAHVISLAQEVYLGETSNVLEHLAWIIGYTILVYVLAIIVFKKNMKK